MQFIRFFKRNFLLRNSTTVSNCYSLHPDHDRAKCCLTATGNFVCPIAFESHWRANSWCHASINARETNDHAIIQIIREPESFFDVDVYNRNGVSRTQFLARVIFHVHLLFWTARRLMVTVSFLCVSRKHDLLLDIPVKLILGIDCMFVECGFATKSNGILFLHSFETRFQKWLNLHG